MRGFIGGEVDSEQALQALMRQLGGLSNFWKRITMKG